MISLPEKPGRGFTLIELLVTITIVAVLVGISFPAYQGFQNMGKRKTAAAEIQLMTLKFNDFRLDNGFLPAATFIGGTAPESIRDSGEYDANPADPDYQKASRVLFLALTGRGTFDFNSRHRDYLKPSSASVADRVVKAGDKIDPLSPRTYEKHEFNAGSYLIDPWGNPYGYYHDPENAKFKSFNSPSSFDIWTTAGKNESDDKSRERWLTSWKFER